MADAADHRCANRHSHRGSASRDGENSSAGTGWAGDTPMGCLPAGLREFLGASRALFEDRGACIALAKRPRPRLALAVAGRIDDRLRQPQRTLLIVRWREKEHLVGLPRARRPSASSVSIRSAIARWVGFSERCKRVASSSLKMTLSMRSRILGTSCWIAPFA